MMTVRLEPQEANLAQALAKLGLNEADVDPNFGLVSLDPGANLYAVLVDEAAVAKVQPGEDVKGPYSNPRIEPFGPPSRPSS